MGAKVFDFSYTVTLNEGQGHPNWFQNVGYRGLYHHIKFKRNRSVNICMQANVNFVSCRNRISKVPSLENGSNEIK